MTQKNNNRKHNCGGEAFFSGSLVTFADETILMSDQLIDLMNFLVDVASVIISAVVALNGLVEIFLRFST